MPNANSSPPRHAQDTERVARAELRRADVRSALLNWMWRKRIHVEGALSGGGREMATIAWRGSWHNLEGIRGCGSGAGSVFARVGVG